MILIIFLLVFGLGLVIYGGLVARRTISGVNLLTIPGALIGCVGFFQFVLYGLAIVPIMFVLLFVTINQDESHIAFNFSHSFNLSLSESELQISDLEKYSTDASEVTQLLAQVDVAGTNLTTTILLVCVSVILWILSYFILNNARAVLRSLYDRTPFVLENPQRLRRIAGYWIGMWIVYSGYVIAMTSYLQSQLDIVGGTLHLIELPFATPLIVAGLLVVMAEVFRIGFELKEENALTV